MRNLRDLNINEGGQPVKRKPPTAAQIEQLQSEFQITLPVDYVAFLRFSNGGSPAINAFRPKGLAENDIWNVDYFYRLGDKQDDASGIVTATRAWRMALSANIIAIGDDGGGNQILLSFDEDPPSVKLCVHDDHMRLMHVADSFEEFVDMLFDDPDLI